MASKQMEQELGRLRLELTHNDWVGEWSWQYDLDTETGDDIHFLQNSAILVLQSLELQGQRGHPPFT